MIISAFVLTCAMAQPTAAASVTESWYREVYRGEMAAVASVYARVYSSQPPFEAGYPLTKVAAALRAAICGERLGRRKDAERFFAGIASRQPLADSMVRFKGTGARERAAMIRQLMELWVRNGGELLAAPESVDQVRLPSLGRGRSLDLLQSHASAIRDRLAGQLERGAIVIEELAARRQQLEGGISIATALRRRLHGLGINVQHDDVVVVTSAAEDIDMEFVDDLPRQLMAGSEPFQTLPHDVAQALSFAGLRAVVAGEASRGRLIFEIAERLDPQAVLATSFFRQTETWRSDVALKREAEALLGVERLRLRGELQRAMRQRLDAAYAAADDRPDSSLDGLDQLLELRSRADPEVKTNEETEDCVSEAMLVFQVVAHEAVVRDELERLWLERGRQVESAIEHAAAIGESVATLVHLSRLRPPHVRRGQVPDRALQLFHALLARGRLDLSRERTGSAARAVFQARLLTRWFPAAPGFDFSGVFRDLPRWWDDEDRSTRKSGEGDR